MQLLRFIMNEDRKPKLLGGFGDLNYGKQYRLGNRVYDSREIAMCICSNPVGNLGGYSYLYLVVEDEKNSE